VQKGDAVGPYQIVQRLGGKRDAHVFSVTRAVGSRAPIAALKIPSLEGGAEALEVFKMKAEIALYTTHPNLVRAIEVGEEGALPYLVMELLDGVHLSALLARGIPLNGGVAAAIARSLAEALHHLHTLQDENGRSLGVLHLDVDANHVLVGRDGTVKLLDYGAYAHRIQSTRPLDPTYDIHCLGALLSEMVRETADQYLYKIIARATAERPEDRFKSAHEMADALSVHLLTYPGFRPEISVRQLTTSLESRLLADPMVHRPDSFASATDTRVRTTDLTPAPRVPLMGTFFWIGFGATLMALIAFVIYRLFAN
jgi:hypothetical protein